MGVLLCSWVLIGGPPPPTPRDPDFIVGNKFTKRNIDAGFFRYPDFRVPDPPPSLSSNTRVILPSRSFMFWPP